MIKEIKLEEAKRLENAEAKRIADEHDKQRKLDDAKFNALFELISGNKKQKLTNYIFNGSFDKQQNSEKNITVKIFNEEKCILGWEDQWNGYIKILWKNIDPLSIKIKESNGFKIINLSGIKDIAEVGIKSKNLPDNFIQVLKEQSLFPPKSEPKKLKSIDLPISKTNNYELYILKRSMEKLSQDLCYN